MPLSTLTAYVPIPEDSDATPGLWDTRFQAAYANAAQVNADLFTPSGNTFSFGTYALSASTASFLGALVPFVSVGTLQAYSGNTITIPSHLSLGNNRITFLGEPSGVSDGATKNYVDVNAAGKLTHYADPVPHNSVSNSTTTLSLLTIGAGKLATNGDAIHVTAWGDLTTTGSGVAALTLFYGTSAMLLWSGTAAALWRLTATILRTGAATERGEGFVHRSTAAVTHSQVSMTETLANAIPIWVTVYNNSGLNSIAVNQLGLTAEVVQQ